MLWFSVACFGVRVSVTFHLSCVHIILIRFGLLSGHLLGNSSSLGIPYVLFYFDYLYFQLFEGWIWVLIASVSGNCILFTLIIDE